MNKLQTYYYSSPLTSIIEIETAGILCTSSDNGGNENVGETPGTDWDTI